MEAGLQVLDVGATGRSACGERRFFSSGFFFLAELAREEVRSLTVPHALYARQSGSARPDHCPNGLIVNCADHSMLVDNAGPRLRHGELARKLRPEDRLAIGRPATPAFTRQHWPVVASMALVRRRSPRRILASRLTRFLDGADAATRSGRTAAALPFFGAGVPYICQPHRQRTPRARNRFGTRV
jgi:hypothetical protein